MRTEKVGILANAPNSSSEISCIFQNRKPADAGIGKGMVNAVYTPTEPAQWIWYPGDFEFYLGLRVLPARWERLAQITTEWKMETFYPNVRFRSPEFAVTEPVTFKIYTTGTCCVQVDKGWYYQYDHRTGLTLEPGTHSLMVTVFNAHELPSVYVDAPCIHTDKYWEVTCGDFDWFPVGCWNFTDRKVTPSDFRLETTPVQPVEVRQVNDGVFYDFGRELMAFVKGTQVTGSGTVHISYGESDTEALDVEGCEAFDEFDAHGDFVSPQTRAFRYIFVQTGGDLAIGHIEALYEYLPLENKGDFHCDDERLNRIYDVALHTLHLNSREFFLDGIKRDRWVWSGDATQSYLLNFYSFNDNAICQRTMRFLRGKDPLKTHMNTIQDYTLYWFISLYDYYLYTNDTEFFLKMYPSAKKLMEEFCFKFVDERGFMVAQPDDWVFIDWVEMENRDKGDISFIQILFARALEAMKVMAGIFGDTEGEQRYGRLSENLLKKCFEVFWSEKHHAFTHHPASDPNTIVTRYANMFALMFGYLNNEQREQVIQNVILNDDVIAITTPYMKFYELMALCEAGRFDTVRQYISDYWGGMLDLGATSFWEAYDPNQKGAEHYQMYFTKYGKSLCHAWGAGPIVLYGKYFLGIRPTKAGYAEFEVVPQLGGLHHISGKAPTPDGSIEVDYDGKTLRVVNRSGGTGTLRIGDRTATVLPHSEQTLTAAE